MNFTRAAAASFPSSVSARPHGASERPGRHSLRGGAGSQFFIALIAHLAVLALAGCASTSIRYPSGQRALATQADAQDITFTGGGVHFSAGTLIHTTPITAQARGAATIIKSVGGTSGAIQAAAGPSPSTLDPRPSTSR